MQKANLNLCARAGWTNGSSREQQPGSRKNVRNHIWRWNGAPQPPSSSLSIDLLFWSRIHSAGKSSLISGFFSAFLLLLLSSWSLISAPHVLMNTSSFVLLLLLVLVRLFTAGLLCFCLRSALVYFPIENFPVSLTQKDLERVQGPPAESPGEAGKPLSWNLGRISTVKVNFQRKLHFGASQVLGWAVVWLGIGYISFGCARSQPQIQVPAFIYGKSIKDFCFKLSCWS